MLNEQEAPKYFVIMAYKPDQEGSHSYAQWAGSPQVILWIDNKDSDTQKWNDRGPELSGISALLY